MFDECHNAVGNSPMAAIMKDCLAPHLCAPPTVAHGRKGEPLAHTGSRLPKTDNVVDSLFRLAGAALPRILGLTASFAARRIKPEGDVQRKLEATRRYIEQVYHATIYSPVVKDSDLQETVASPWKSHSFEQVQ